MHAVERTHLASHYHCKNESVYCTLNCPNTHTKNKNSVCIGTKWCAVNTFVITQLFLGKPVVNDEDRTFETNNEAII